MNEDRTAADYAKRLRRVELMISKILRVGVVTSLAIIVAGTLLSFVHHPDYLTSPSELARLTKPGAAFPRTLTQVVHGLRQLRGQAGVVVGLLLLVATPVARVAASTVGFAYLRERTYVVITTVVFALLVLSFWCGRAAG
jgi:uncharacterized membrane protein